MDFTFYPKASCLVPVHNTQPPSVATEKGLRDKQGIGAPDLGLAGDLFRFIPICPFSSDLHSGISRFVPGLLRFLPICPDLFSLSEQIMATLFCRPHLKVPKAPHLIAWDFQTSKAPEFMTFVFEERRMSPGKTQDWSFCFSWRGELSSKQTCSLASLHFPTNKSSTGGGDAHIRVDMEGAHSRWLWGGAEQAAQKFCVAHG